MTRRSQIPPELLDEMTPAVRAFVESLLQRIDELERRLNDPPKTPQNSSKPPSSEHPHAKPLKKNKKKTSKRKQGGQPGHPKHERPLIPAEECDQVIPLLPSECRRCGTGLRGEDSEPLRHQVWELPEIKPDVTGFSGVIHCDRAKMDWNLGLDPPPEPRQHRLQWCWAHLKRDFQALSDSSDNQVKRLGDDLMRPTRELFEVWARYRDGTITRRGFQRLMAPIRREIDRLILRGAFSGNPRLAGMCDELYDHRDWLWTFVDVAGVEPTNNASERSLRHAVIWRKLSFGTQSAHGSRFTERMLTAIETCRQQSRDVFGYLTETLTAHFHDRPAPSLLPEA